VIVKINSDPSNSVSIERQRSWREKEKLYENKSFEDTVRSQFHDSTAIVTSVAARSRRRKKRCKAYRNRTGRDGNRFEIRHGTFETVQHRAEPVRDFGPPRSTFRSVPVRRGAIALTTRRNGACEHRKPKWRIVVAHLIYYYIALYIYIVALKSLSVTILCSGLRDTPVRARTLTYSKTVVYSVPDRTKRNVNRTTVLCVSARPRAQRLATVRYSRPPRRPRRATVLGIRVKRVARDLTTPLTPEIALFFS